MDAYAIYARDGTILPDFIRSTHTRACRDFCEDFTGSRDDWPKVSAYGYTCRPVTIKERE